jgi:hypothetical protein
VSGTPFTVTANGGGLNMPGGLQTANLNGSYKVIGDKGDSGYYFDPSSFSQPQGVVQGNTGRNQFRGPGYWNLDGSLFRGFPLGGGGKRIEFRAEFFNLTNTPLWGLPTADISSGNFGRVTTVGNDGRGNGSARDSGTGERQIRFGLRFQF